MDTTLLEAKRLYKLGFSILWLKPKSKAPVRAKWTTGSRETWEALQASYRPNYNVGVRLGTTSAIFPKGFKDNTPKYLAVLDVDVKSTKEEDQREAEKAVRELFPTLPKKPIQVMSGRGNGSSHIYCITNTPVSPYTKIRSEKRVKVFMPSVAPSKNASEFLTEKEIKEGYRIRPAWEISVMGEGQQVVLPPSIHPDSGKSYKWRNKLERVSNLTELDLGSGAPKKDRTATNDWTPEIVDLVSPSGMVSDEIYDLIVGGATEDRSAALLKVSVAMVLAGFTDRQIMSVLTDQEYELGKVAYEHAKTTSRKRAANWLYNYTLKKARDENDIMKEFENEVEEIPLSEDEAEEQAKELVNTVIDWRMSIQRTASKTGLGAPKNTLKNVVLILRNDVGEKVFKRNDFSGTELYGMSTPWGGKEDHELTDVDVILIKSWLAKRFRFEPSNDRINEAIMEIAHCNRFHPVRDYLNALPDWDGKPRLNEWLHKALHAKGPEEYIRAVARKTICAMVARVMRPGTKFDQVVILEGAQGVGKSTFVRKLASDLWFSDAHINISDKDAILSMKAVWIVELGELGGMRKADIDQLKEFISRTTDRIRVPYGKRTENFPRQCIFIGTTNSDDYLKDLTGNRRFWPVSVGHCDWAWIDKNRDQLFAEAKIYDMLGEPLFLENSETNNHAISEQNKRVFTDSLIDTFEAFFLGECENFPKEKFTTADLFGDFGPAAGLRGDRGDQMRAAEALKYMGFKKLRERDEKGEAGRRIWVKREKGPYPVHTQNGGMD